MKEKPSTRTAHVVAANKRLRERVFQAGGRRIEALLDPEATRALNVVQVATGETITAVLERLLIEAAAKELDQ